MRFSFFTHQLTLSCTMEQLLRIKRTASSSFPFRSFCFTVLIVHQNYTKTLTNFLKKHSTIPFEKKRNLMPLIVRWTSTTTSQLGDSGRRKQVLAGMKNCATPRSLWVFMIIAKKRVKHVTSHSLDGFRNKVTLMTWYKWNNYRTVVQRCRLTVKLHDKILLWKRFRGHWETIKISKKLCTTLFLLKTWINEIYKQ